MFHKLATRRLRIGEDIMKHMIRLYSKLNLNQVNGKSGQKETKFLLLENCCDEVSMMLALT
jgi:hypothetical protein